MAETGSIKQQQSNSLQCLASQGPGHTCSARRDGCKSGRDEGVMLKIKWVFYSFWKESNDDPLGNSGLPVVGRFARAKGQQV
jgi:hypothetical protein